jgi:hypothetical protein
VWRSYAACRSGRKLNWPWTQVTLTFFFTSSSSSPYYSGCQKNVPIAGCFFVTTTYAAILFAEHNYDKRYRLQAAGSSFRKAAFKVNAGVRITAKAPDFGNCRVSISVWNQNRHALCHRCQRTLSRTLHYLELNRRRNLGRCRRCTRIRFGHSGEMLLEDAKKYEI